MLRACRNIEFQVSEDVCKLLGVGKGGDMNYIHNTYAACSNVHSGTWLKVKGLLALAGYVYVPPTNQTPMTTMTTMTTISLRSSS